MNKNVELQLGQFTWDHANTGEELIQIHQYQWTERMETPHLFQETVFYARSEMVEKEIERDRNLYTILRKRQSSIK